MTEPTTIRECWERVKARHERSHPDSDWCKHGCGTSPWPCLDYSDAVAALDLLAAMEDDLATQRDRADEWKRRYEFMETHPSYVPDPAPRGDAS